MSGRLFSPGCILHWTTAQGAGFPLLELDRGVRIIPALPWLRYGRLSGRRNKCACIGCLDHLEGLVPVYRRYAGRHSSEDFMGWINHLALTSPNSNAHTVTLEIATTLVFTLECCHSTGSFCIRGLDDTHCNARRSLIVERRILNIKRWTLASLQRSRESRRV